MPKIHNKIDINYYNNNCPKDLKGSLTITEASSKLVADLLELEEAFHHNLELLKIKDSEISRCNCENIRLNRELEDAQKENLTLKKNNDELQRQVLEKEIQRRTKEFQYENEKIILNKNINTLSQKLEEANRIKKNEIENLRKQFENEKEVAKCKIQNLHQQIEDQHKIIEKQKEVQSRLEGLQSSYQSEMKNLQANLFEKTAEIASRETQIRQLENKLIIDKEDYKSKLELTRNQLMEQIEPLKRASATHQTKLQEALSENLDLKGKLAQLSQQFNSVEIEKTNREQEVSKLSKALGEAIECNKKLCRDKEELEFRSTCAKEPENALRKICSYPEHEKFEEFAMQNATLRQVVKGMRKERIDNNFNVEETEKRLEKLENLVLQLKESL